MRIIFNLYFLIALASSGKMFGQVVDTLVIENVNVIPMTSEIILKNKRVFISNGKIVKIESSFSPFGSKFNQIIDGTDKYLTPGFSEMHYHYRSNDIESDFKLLLANGITTVRNMAEFKGQDHIAIKERVLTGAILGPNYYTTGPYLTSNDLKSEIEVSKVVKMHRDKKYDFLKIADNLPKNIYLKLIEEGKQNNIPIIGHSQRNLPFEYSVRMKSIEHIEEFLYLSTDGSAKSFFKSDITELNKLATQIEQSGIYIGTTLSVFEFINNCLDDQSFATLKKDNLVKYLAPDQRESFLSEKNDYRKLKNRTFDNIQAKDLFETYFSWMKSFTNILSNNNVNLLTGSDTYGMVIVGFSLHREFELLQESGIKPYDILLATTVNPARYLDTYAMEGTVTEGKNANLVLLDRNPLEDIKNTKSIAGVIKKGKWLDREELNTMLTEVEKAFK